MTPSQIAGKLNEQIETVCRHLLPGGRRKQFDWVAGSVRGEKGDSLKVRINGEKVGVWSDFATGETGGDMLDLWCATRGCNLRTAMAEASNFLGLAMDGEDSRPRREYRKPPKPRCARLRETSVAMAWLKARGFSEQTIEDYRLAETSEGEIVFPYLRCDGSFVNAKYRGVPKRFRQENGAEPCLFGWHVIESHYPNSRIVTVCEGECFTGAAQVLTERGWVAFSDYAGGKVAQFESDGSISFVYPLARVRKIFDGTLVESSSAQFYSLTTPGHSMISIDQRKGVQYKHTASDGPRSRAHLIPRCGIADGPGIDLTDAQIALCIAVSADATIDVRKMGYAGGQARKLAIAPRYARFCFKKRRKIERMESIIETLGMSASNSEIASGHRSICFGLPDWVPGRMLPWEWVEKASASQREFILSELIEWDGNRVNGRTMTEYSSKYVENAEWVQAMAHLSGRCSSVVRRKNQFGSWFKTTILNGKSTSSWQTVKTREIGYSGLVHCVQVPSGALLVRQNEIVSISGNCDCLALHQIGIPALSVPNGGGGGHKQDWIDADYDELQRFDVVYLCLDNDEPGRQATDEIMRRIGVERCRIVEIPYPHKDANDWLLAGMDRESFLKQMAKARTRDPDDLKPAGYFRDKVLALFRNEDGDRPPVGTACPWPSLYRDMRFRDGEITLWAGYNGHGKSAIVSNVMASSLRDGGTWCVASMEMTGERTLQRLIRQMFVLHRPPESSIESVLAWLNERSWFFNVIGEAKIDRMMRVFEYAARRYQIKHFIVDSLAKCGLDEDDFNGQKRCVERLCDFKYKHDVHVHLIAHARKGHSESDRPHKHDVKGSGAITDLVENVVMVWRDKDAEQQNRDRQSHIEEHDFMSTAEIAVEKQRNHQWEGIVKLYYDTVSMRYMEIAANPQPYIDNLALEEIA